MAKPASMIRQHFEHPDGATATLDMPAGWARDCHYILTVCEPGREPEVTRRDFDTPAAARAGAVARQRFALADGWQMRMQQPAHSPTARVMELFTSLGERIDCLFESVQFRSPEIRYSRSLGPMAEEDRRVSFDISGLAAANQVRPGSILLFRTREGAVTTQMAVQVTGVSYSVDSGEISATLDGIAEAPTEHQVAAIDREASIQEVAATVSANGVIDSGAVWAMLRDAFPDASERERALARVMQITAARRQEEMRRQEAERARQRQQLLDTVNTSTGVFQPAGILRPGRHNISHPAVDTSEAAIKRLSGGQMPGEKKRRRINLGE